MHFSQSENHPTRVLSFSRTKLGKQKRELSSLDYLTDWFDEIVGGADSELRMVVNRFVQDLDGCAQAVDVVVEKSPALTSHDEGRRWLLLAQRETIDGIKQELVRLSDNRLWIDHYFEACIRRSLELNGALRDRIYALDDVSISHCNMQYILPPLYLLAQSASRTQDWEKFSSMIALATNCIQMIDDLIDASKDLREGFNTPVTRWLNTTSNDGTLPEDALRRMAEAASMRLNCYAQQIVHSCSELGFSNRTSQLTGEVQSVAKELSTMASSSNEFGLEDLSYIRVPPLLCYM